MKTNMLGNNKVLRQLWNGPLGELMIRFNGKRGPETEEMLKKLLRDELMPIPVSLETEGITIVKTVLVTIGDGRTTDQIVADAKNLEGENRLSYINTEITQANMPSGHGRSRISVVEFFQFDRSTTTDEVRARCEEPGYSYSTYEDGLRFQENHPDYQKMAPHIFIPESPWVGEGGSPRALTLWRVAGDRQLYLTSSYLHDGWPQNSLFARRRYIAPTPIS